MLGSLERFPSIFYIAFRKIVGILQRVLLFFVRIRIDFQLKKKYTYTRIYMRKRGTQHCINI